MGLIENLRELGIRLNCFAIGEHYAACPKCSPTRRKKHVRCLSVRIEPDRALYNCHHCKFHGAVYADTRTPGDTRKTRYQGRDRMRAWLGQFR